MEEGKELMSDEEQTISYGSQTPTSVEPGIGQTVKQ